MTACGLRNLRECSLRSLWNKSLIWRVRHFEGRTDLFPRCRFNRGWLFNVGLRMAMQEPELRPDCLVTHDVDNVPMQGVTFNNCQCAGRMFETGMCRAAR